MKISFKTARNQLVNSDLNHMGKLLISVILLSIYLTHEKENRH